MIKILPIALLLFGCLVSNGLAESIYGDNLPDDWKDPHYRVFGGEAEKISPEETYQLLLKLIDIYKDRHDEGSKVRRARAQALINAKATDAINCNHMYFTKMTDLIAFYMTSNINVVPYLKKCRVDHMRFCLPIFVERIKADIEQIDEKDKIDLEALEKSVMKSGYINQDSKIPMHIPRKSIMDGAVDYLTERTGALNPQELKGKSGKKRLVDLYIDNIVRLCERVDGKIYQDIRVFKNLIFDPDILSILDDFTLTWVGKERLCAELVLELYSLTSEIHKDLTKKSGCSKLSKILGGCFGS